MSLVVDENEELIAHRDSSLLGRHIDELGNTIVCERIGDSELYKRQRRLCSARHLCTQPVVKGVTADTALSYSRYDESLDTRSRKSTVPIRFYGGNNPTSYSTEAYVIEPGHINVHSRHVCDRSAPLDISQSLTVRL